MLQITIKYLNIFSTQVKQKEIKNNYEIIITKEETTTTKETLKDQTVNFFKYHFTYQLHAHTTTTANKLGFVWKLRKGESNSIKDLKDST